MAGQPPIPPPRPPRSPDELDQGGLRGRISGVTRVGRGAMAGGFIVLCGLLVAILFAVNKSSTPQAPVATSPPFAPPTGEAHFGQNEPIVPPTSSPAPPTIPPIELATPAPPPAAAQPESAQQSELDKEAAAERQAALDAEKKRLAELDAANHAPILAGGQGLNQAGGGGNVNATGGAAQLTYAGTGSQAQGPVGGLPGAGGAGGVGGAALVGRPVAFGPPTPDPRAFLAGPTNQYGEVQSASNVELPPGANPKDFLQSQRFAPFSPYQLEASSVIPAVLITGIDSELPGLLAAQVRENVYDTKTGRHLLIPKGTRLVGVYKSNISTGQTRVQVAWTRMIFPDTTSIDLIDMPGADVQGGAGLAGTVDNHTGRLFGATLLSAVLAAGLQLSQPQQSSSLTNPSAGQVAAGGVGQSILQTAQQLAQQALNIPPTLHIPKGYPFIVVVDRDIVFPGPYRPE